MRIIFWNICDLYVCAGRLFDSLGILTEGSDVSKLVTVAACHLGVPLLGFTNTANKSCAFLVSGPTGVGLIALPLGEVVVCLGGSLGPFISTG
jgi:hypothetical protein